MHDKAKSALPELFALLSAAYQAEPADSTATGTLAAHSLQKQLNLKLSEHGCERNELIRYLREYLRHTPDTARPEFNKLLFSGMDETAVLADWVTSLSNTTMHTYQVAPVASLMEREIIARLNTLIGFDQAPDIATSAGITSDRHNTTSGGIMTSGGSSANMLAMMMARHRACPDIKQQGIQNRTLVAYVSDQAHYSYEKAANTLGIGTRNLIAVASDDEARMIPEALQLAIEQSIVEGKQAFFIGLTAGTTVTGAFDNIAQAAAIARQHALWLHIDGAWGAPALFSSQHRSLLEGSEMADSFSWDAHKLMNIPLTASLILVKQQSDLEQCCAGGGEAYLFHQDKNAEFNSGRYSLQCGRRVDALKLWLSWKANGTQGYAAKVDHLMTLKQAMLNQIQAQPELQVLAPAPFLNVLFRYAPSGWQDEQQLAELNISICQSLRSQGLAYVDYAHYKGRLGIRFILANADLNQSHIDRLLAHCLKAGKALQQ